MKREGSAQVSAHASRRGIDVAALFYTLLESAELAGVGPHTYPRPQSALRYMNSSRHFD